MTPPLSLDQLAEIESGIAQFRVTLRELGDSNLGAATEELLVLQEGLVAEVRRLRSEIDTHRIADRREQRTHTWEPIDEHIPDLGYMLQVGKQIGDTGATLIEFCVQQDPDGEFQVSLMIDGQENRGWYASDDDAAFRFAEQCGREIGVFRECDVIVRPDGTNILRV